MFWVFLIVMKIPLNAQLHFTDQRPAAFQLDSGVAGVQKSGTLFHTLFGCSFHINGNCVSKFLKKL